MDLTTTWSTQLQPRYASSFRCIGADCEDNCCYGWRVCIDKDTYDKYQQCPDPEIRSSFNRLITIDEGSSRKDDYASLMLSQSGCAFLAERLCSIQTKLGESHLPKTCATYPRYFNVVGDALEVTLDMSCPEAARLTSASSSQMDFVESPKAPDIPIPAFLDPHPAFPEVRSFTTGLLRNRNFPLWQRLTILGYFCDDIDGGHPSTELTAKYQ